MLMKKVLFLFFILGSFYNRMVAQQNWAAVPCSYMKNVVSLDRMFLDSLHNEIILVSVNGSTICNTKFKGVVAYNGNGFHDLDKGFNLYDPNAQANSLLAWDCITYGNQTLFAGGFESVGSDTLYCKSIALWNGAIWDTFPTHVFSNKVNNSGGGFCGFLKNQGKLWMYGGFDTIGNTLSQNLVAYDGNTFTAVPTMPANNYYPYHPITKMIAYKNKLIAGGNFYNYNSSNSTFTFFRLAQFDGTSWAEMDNGIQGSIGFVYDMAIYQDTLYISGAWDKSAGNAGNYIVKWDGNHLYDAGFGGFCGYGNVRSLVPFHNRLYAFGNFPCAANQKAFGVAYYENGAWTVPQDSVAGPSIGNGLVYNDELYMCGGFESINGDTTIHLFAKLLCPDFDAATGCVSSVRQNYLQELNVNVYPNPVSDKITVEINQNIAQDLTLNIFDTLGQQIYSTKIHEQKQELNLSFLKPGVYYIKMNASSGQRVVKLIKE